MPSRFLSMACFIIALHQVHAEPITYFFHLAANGVLNGRPFTNAPATVAVYADTVDVQRVLDSYVVEGQVVALVSGIGYAVYSDRRSLYCDIAGVRLADMLRIGSGAYATYDLKTNSSRITFSGDVTSYPSDLSTSIGTLRLRHRNSIAFEARLGPHLSPLVSSSPVELSVIEGSTPELNLDLQGSPPMWIQWQKDSLLIPNGTQLPLVITNATVSDSGDYQATITNVFGKATSSIIRLQVNRSSPVLTRQPISQGAVIGSNLTLEAAALGSPPLDWQWFFEDQPIEGATSNILTRKIDATLLGKYHVVVSNELGVVSTPAIVVDKSFVLSAGVSAAPLPLRSSEIISLTGGDLHFLALRANGAVQAWGGNLEGQAEVPPGLANVVSIAAGSTHSLAVAKNGTVQMWGNFFLTEDNFVPEQARSDVAMVAQGVGAQHAVALKRDGTVVVWGAREPHRAALEAIPYEATNIVSIAAGAYHVLALRSDGRLIQWGSSSANAGSPASDLPSAIAIAAGWHHNAALLVNGRIATWGSGGLEPDGLDFIDVACGAEHTLGLNKTGRVVFNGRNTYSQSVIQASATNAVAVASGPFTTFALLGEGPPVFNTVAVDRAVAFGSNAYFRMLAVGAPPIRYQWSFDGAPIQNATNSWLAVTNVQATNTGFYTVSASSDLGAILSRRIGLNIPPARFDNVQQMTTGLALQIQSVAGGLYQLQSRDSLAEGEWIVVTELTANAVSLTFIDDRPRPESRYYRIFRP